MKKKLSGTIDLANMVQKFVDCRTKDVTQREIFIVEGDSALGSCKLARDPDFQAIMPVRGKILNCLKAEYDKVFKSEIITNLIKVLGCGVEANSKHNKDFNTFELENLRWSKIIICTDADEDGYVDLPNVNIVEEMVDMIAASRAYEANATVAENVKSMMQSAMNI